MNSARASTHALSQRKVMLDNSADCLASYRDSLRSNMNSVRKEITETFAQQVGLLRARETELLQQLQIVVNGQEAQLDAQQKELYKLIRQCDSHQLNDEDAESAFDFVNCLTHIDCNPKGCGTIFFDRDLVDLRNSIGKFGSIRFEPDNKKYTGETLPMSMEEYEDDIGMTHKSVHMLSHQPRITASREQLENIRKWLSYVPGRDITHEDLYKMVPEDKTDSEAETNSLCSSFDIIQNVPHEASKSQSFNISWPILSASTPKKEDQPEPEYEFTSEFLKTLNSDAAKWLLGQGTSTGSSTNYSDYVNATAAKYEFQTVIQNIHDSNYADWYLPSCSTQKTLPSSQQDEEMKEVTPKLNYDQIDETLAKNLELLAIFSVHSGSSNDKKSLPVSNKDIDQAAAGDPSAKRKLIAFGHHLWSVMHK